MVMIGWANYSIREEWEEEEKSDKSQNNGIILHLHFWLID